MTSIVDGQPFRDGLKRIADQAKVNLWLDRRVDPSQPIAAGPVGPTVHGAIEQLAASQDCVVAPIDNVVLVGRPEWVDQTLASLLEMERPTHSRATTVQWDDLTTPSEALQRASGQRPPLELPHDLWPQTMWRGVQPPIAVTLVLAQFDQKPEFSNASSMRYRTVDAEPTPSVTRNYFPGQQAKEIRNWIADIDPNHQLKVTANQFRITATPAAHRKLTSRLLDSKQPAGPDPESDTFTVRKMKTSAGNALQQLAASAGRKCVIDPAAMQACNQIVTVEGKDVTLKALIDLVAKQAGVKANWQDDAILITKP